MKKPVLFFFLCLLAALPGRAQLASLIDSTALRGRLFTDGAALYEIVGDSLYAVNTNDGSQTLLHKLPALPAGATSARWQTPIKTPNGFLITQFFRISGNDQYRLWGYDGTSWDTLLTQYGNAVSQVPLQLGNSYVYDFTSPGFADPALIKTDGSRAGTQVVFRPADHMLSYGSYTMYYGPEYANGPSQLFFEMDFTDTTSVTRIRTRLFLLDNNGLNLIDTNNYSTNYLGVINNEVFYFYRTDTLIPGTTTRGSDLSVRKRNLATGASSIVKALSPDVYYYTGTVFKNRLVMKKMVLPTYDSTLISMDPVTGSEIYLSDTFGGVSFMPRGTQHLYIPARASLSSNELIARRLLISDGLSSVVGQPAYSVNTVAYGLRVNLYPLDMAQSIVCGDEVYFAESYTPGALAAIRAQKLFRLHANGTVDSQVTIGSRGYRPLNFVDVGGTVYYSDGGYVDRRVGGLWKITACNTAAAVAHTAPTPDAAFIYPNPAQTAFTVSLGSHFPEVRLELYEATGRRVRQQPVSDNQSVSVADLPAGLYLYRLLLPGGALLHAGRVSVVQ